MPSGGVHPITLPGRFCFATTKVGYGARPCEKSLAQRKRAILLLLDRVIRSLRYAEVRARTVNCPMSGDDRVFTRPRATYALGSTGLMAQSCRFADLPVLTPERGLPTNGQGFLAGDNPAEAGGNW